MSIESKEDLKGLRRIGAIVARALREMARQVAPGRTTGEIDAVGAGILKRYGARSTPQHEYGFPGTACISVNDEAVHGIPGSRIIGPGDVVKIDLEADCGGYVADAARTVVAPGGDALRRNLARCAREAFHRALTAASAGNRTRDVGRAVESHVRRCGYSVIRSLTGHGVGRQAHEPPIIPNYDAPEARALLTEGLVVAVEPIIAAGGGAAYTAPDRWTIRTLDGSLAAHHEETIVITAGEPLVLTAG
jgi:methionyl aminopeptidase